MNYPTRLRDILLVERIRAGALFSTAFRLALNSAATVQLFREMGIVDPATVLPGHWGWRLNQDVGSLMYCVKELSGLASFDEVADVWQRLGEGDLVGMKHVEFVRRIRAVIAAAPEYVELAEAPELGDEAVEPRLLTAVLALGEWQLTNTSGATS